MSKKLKSDPTASFVSTDEMSVILSFVDSPNTFINLSLCNKQVNQQCNLICNNHHNKIEFFRGFSVDPRLSLMRAQQLNLYLPPWSEEIVKNGLDLLIYFKAFFRNPGGNCDEFILKYEVSFRGKEMKVIRSKVQNADGSYYFTAPFESKVERKWINLFSAIEKQSFEKKTPYETLKITTKGHNQDYFYTIFDEVHGNEEFNTDEYDGLWTFVNLNVMSNNEKIFTLVRRTVHEEDLNTNPFDSNPVVANLFKELQEFCQVTNYPESEHDDYEGHGRSNSGLEMEQNAPDDAEVDEEESDNDPVCDILHRLIDPAELSKKSKKKDEENDEEDDEENEDDE